MRRGPGLPWRRRRVALFAQVSYSCAMPAEVLYPQPSEPAYTQGSGQLIVQQWVRTKTGPVLLTAFGYYPAVCDGTPQTASVRLTQTSVPFQKAMAYVNNADVSIGGTNESGGYTQDYGSFSGDVRVR